MRKTVVQVVSEVAKKHGLSYADMASKTRKRAFAWPRQEAMFQAYLECDHASLPMIGKLMGGRDHTTILHGIRAHCERSGYSYDKVRRVFPKDHIGVAAKRQFTAQDYREMARVH